MYIVKKNWKSKKYHILVRNKFKISQIFQQIWTPGAIRNDRWTFHEKYQRNKISSALGGLKLVSVCKTWLKYKKEKLRSAGDI